MDYAEQQKRHSDGEFDAFKQEFERVNDDTLDQLNSVVYFPRIAPQPQVEVTRVGDSPVARNDVVILADGLAEGSDVFEST